MSHPYVQAALVRDRQNMLLAEAEAARLAKQARSRRHQRGTPAIRRPPLRWTLAWLPWAWNRLLTRRQESAYGAFCGGAALHDRPATAGGEAALCSPPGARSVPAMMAEGL
jgi:hypothetical protein